MTAAFDISILWTVLSDIFPFLSNRADKKKDSVVNAHKAINKAFIKTYDYLRNQKGEYIINIELADLWNDASAAVIRVDKQLGEMLYHKSRFWLHPQLYIDLNRERDTIELKEIVDEMERLRSKL